MTPSSNILSISSSTPFCFAGDIGYGRSLKTRAPSISSMECLSMLVTPRPSLSRCSIWLAWISSAALTLLVTGFPTTAGASPKARQKSTPKQLQASDDGSILARSRPDYRKIRLDGNSQRFHELSLPSTLTLAPVSNKPVSCLPKASTSAKGLGSAESMRLTAATTSRRLDLLTLKRSLAFWTLRETRRMPLS
ncbi:uncharacterized protein LOC119559643 [Drosophila subpulchrella]|uniref:uncharacterized protein LOC119559643 n=1 Tax=Drosophila subpulchrella TaxID=1486046 RepID=UPI0018A12D1A|nr:uncharacterized protein LOC119559643 [Drosophila subpulchrella]